MTQDDLRSIFSRDGIYVLADDTKAPNSTCPIIVMGCGPGKPGKAFTMEPRNELSADARDYRESTYLVGGPFSVQTCRAMREECDACDRQRGDAQAEIEFLRLLAGKCRPIVESYGQWMAAAGNSVEAAWAATILRMFAALENARTVADLMEFNKEDGTCT